MQALTVQQGNDVVTSGGRVLCVTALGDTVKQAQQRAYEIAEGIVFNGRQMRTDIGYQGNQALNFRALKKYLQFGRRDRLPDRILFRAGLRPE